MIGLSYLYVTYGNLPQVKDLLWILKPAVLGIIAAGIIKLGGAAIKTVFLAVLVSAAVLAGLWLERWWLVAPALNAPATFGLAEASMTASFAAALALGMLAFERFAPRPADAKEPS